jgi:hypothetical protein
MKEGSDGLGDVAVFGDSAVKFIFDGLVYVLMNARVFGWLWP